MMLRSSRVLSGEPYCHPVGRMRAQEVLAARLASSSSSSIPCKSVTPYRRSARIAAQSTVATYMADDSVVRVPRDLPASVTVRSTTSLSRSNTYADHEYGAGSTAHPTSVTLSGPWSDEVVEKHLVVFSSLVAEANAPAENKEIYHRRLYNLHRFLHDHGHRFLWKYEGLCQSVVAKAREFVREFHKLVGLTAKEREHFRSILLSIISRWED